MRMAMGACGVAACFARFSCVRHTYSCGTEWSTDARAGERTLGMEGAKASGPPPKLAVDETFGLEPWREELEKKTRSGDESELAA